MYRDETKARHCRNCHTPLPANWSQAICATCLSGPYWRWREELDHRVYTYERIDLFRDQPHRFDTWEMRG